MQNKKKLGLVLCLVVLLVVGAVCMAACTKKDTRGSITFQGVEEIHAPVGTVTEESLLAGVTAVDANGKDKKVTVDLGDADLSKPGRYMIEYKAGDTVLKELVYLYGDISFQVNGKNLEGDAVEIDFATAISSLHFAKILSATDSFGNAITAKLVEGDKFDYSVGTYTAKYTATDKAGQTAEKTVTFTVTSTVEMTVQSGVSVKYEQESAIFKVDLDGEKDIWLMANGGLVSIADYTVSEKGLELKASYFRTLLPGENTLKICSVNGSTEFSFTVVDTGKPIFSFDSLYKTYIITGDAAVYEMPQAQIASHEYTYTFKVTKDGVTYKAQQLGESVLFTTSSGKNLTPGIYEVSVTATNKADTSKKTTIKRDFRIYTNQTEIDGWEFWNAPQAATMVNVDLSDMGYYRTAWKYDAKSTAAWDSRVQWMKAVPKTFQSITFDFYVYSLGIAEKENGPVKYVGKDGKADILFNALTMGGESLAFMFYDQNGNVVPQDALKMNTWYTMKLDVAEFSGEETAVFMVSSMNNVRKVGMYITEMHFWAYEGSGAQNVFKSEDNTATIQRNAGKSTFVSATVDDETVWMYTVTDKHMPSTALKRALRVKAPSSKEVISIDFKFMEDPKDAWGNVLAPTMFVHDVDHPQKDIAYAANYTLVDAETGKPVETPEVGKWYTLYITTKGRENFNIFVMGENENPLICKVAFKNLKTYDVDLGNATFSADFGNVARSSLYKNAEGKWQYSYVSYTGWGAYNNDTWRRRGIIRTTGDVSKVTFLFKFELSEYLEKGKEAAADNFVLFAGVEQDKHPALVTVIYDQNGNPAGESDIVSGQWYYAVVTREDGKNIVNPFNLLVGGYANGGDGNIVNIEMELRDLQGIASTAEKLTIDFDLNYENAPDYDETLTVVPFNTYGELPAPEQRTDGKYFNGWYKDPECTEAVIDSMLVTQSHTLYAKWGDRPLLNVTFTYPDYGTYYAEVFTSKQGADTIHKYASTMPNDANRWHEGVYAEYRRVTMNIADELGDTIVMDVMIQSVTDMDGNALDTSTLTIYPAGSNAAREVIYTDAEGNPVDANALVVGQWYTATFTGVGAQSYDIYPFALGEAGGGEKGIFYMKNIKLIPGETPDTPDEDDFNPTLRFAITSDTHLFNRYQGSDPQEARLANVFKVSYRYAQQSAYNKLDAVLVAGDISEGDAGEFVMFKDIVDANIQEGTQLIVGMGNHDFRGGLEASAWTEDAAKKLEAAFKETFGLESADQHVVIGGYHFISLSPNAENLGNNVGESYSQTKLAWLEAEIQKAIAEDATKPVFVMQHHHPSGTVYGSGAAGGKQADLFNLLSKYPQVVDFSGHSHYPINDPRNVWQGAFTAIGTGTLFYVGLDINGGPSGISPDGYQGDYSTSGTKNGADYGVFQIIEVNADNDIRVIVYDLRSFEELSRFVIPNPVENKDFKIEQEVPVFAEDTDIYYEDGYIYVQQAVSEDIIESYRAEVYEGGKLIGAYYGLSGYVYPKQQQPEYVRIKVGELAENKGYTVKVYAVNAYNELSEALVFVTAEPDTKVIFDLDYEGAPAPEEVLLVGGKGFGKLPRPNRTEYAFGGWFTEKNGAGEQITADTIVEGECTLYAYWFVPDEPKPDFDGTLGVTNIGAGVLPEPTLQYVNDAWTFVYDGNGKDYSMYDRFLKITFGNSVTENKVTLKAKITNVNGGSTAYTACGSGLVSIFDSEGKTVAENLVNGKSVGLKADEWYTFVYTKADGSAYTPGSWSHLGGFGAGYADIHIKDVAFEKYDIEGLTFEVTFNLNHEGAADPAVVKVAGGKTVGDKLPTPEREGYKFNGWSTSKWGWGMGKAFAADTVVSGSQTVYAMWTIDPEVFGYTFSYPNAEGTYYLNISVAELDNETVVKYATTANNHSGVTAYYRRAMLHIDSTAGQQIVVKMMAPADAGSAQTKLTVHNAAGTALDITITNAGGEKVDALVAGQWCTVSFISDGSENYQIRPFDGGGTMGTLYIKDAKAEEIPVNEVKFDLNYEGAGALESMNVVVGNAYGNLPRPKRTDYAFGGWYKTENCTGEAVTAETIVSESHTLYAKWFVPTDPKPTMDATLTTFTGFTSAGTIHQPTLEYIDGEWVYVYVGSDVAYSAAQRYLRIDVGASVQESKITMKIKMVNVSGANTVYTPCGSLSVTIYDLEGNPVAANALQADVWYTFVHTKASGVLANSWWHLGGFGQNTGTMDIYIKDVVFGEVEEEPDQPSINVADYFRVPTGSEMYVNSLPAGTVGYYGSVTAAVFENETVFKHENTPTVNGTAGRERRTHLIVSATEKQIVSMQVYFVECGNGGTPSIEILRGDALVAGFVVTDANGNIVNHNKLELNKWYTVSWIADGSEHYRIYPITGSAAHGTYYMRNISVQDAPNSAVTGNYYTWVLPVETSGSYMVHARYTNDPTDMSHRQVSLAVDSAVGDVISMKVQMVKTSGTQALKVLSSANAEMAITITDAEGNAVDSGAMEFGKWYTVSWVSDGSATYNIRAFEGQKANGTYYVKDVTVLDGGGLKGDSAVRLGAKIVDGEIVYTYKTSGTNTAQTRVLYFKNDGTHQKLTYKIKFIESSHANYEGFKGYLRHYSGTYIYPVATDADGNLVANDNASYVANVKPGVWYTITLDAGAGKTLSGNIWTFTYGTDAAGDNATVEFEIKDVEYIDAATKYDVTFDLNYEGAGAAPEKITREEGAAYGTLPTPTRKYHIFDGWYTDAEGTNAVDVNAGVTANTTLYAKWTLDTAALGYEFTYASGINQYYSKVTSVEIDGDLVFKYYVRPHGESTAASDRRVYLKLANGEKQIMSMQVKFTACSGTPAIVIYDEYVAGKNIKVGQVITDVEGNIVDGNNLELDKWYTVTWITDASAHYQIRPFNGTKIDGTFYIKDITIKDLEGPLASTYYAWVAPFTMGDQTAYMCYARPTGDGTNYTHRRVDLSSTAANGDVISMKVMMAETTGTPLFVVRNASNTVMTTTITAADGGIIDSTAMALGKWYTVSWTADGSATYQLLAFDGTKANGTYFIKEIKTQKVEDPVLTAETNATITVKNGTYVYNTKATNNAGNRVFYFHNDGNAQTLTYKLKFNKSRWSGAEGDLCYIRHYNSGFVYPVVTDENGNVIEQANRQVGVWYTVTLQAPAGTKLPSKIYTYTYGTGSQNDVDVELEIKDIVFTPYGTNAYDVSFNLNYEGAGAGPEKITREAGAVYGTLPTPTAEQTRKNSSDYCYSFGGWYLNADCTGEAVKPSDVVDQTCTLYAKWIAISFQPRGTGNVYSAPVTQYEGDEIVYVLKASGSGNGSSEQSRLNMMLSVGNVYAASYKVMVKNDADAPIKYVHNGNCATDIYDSNMNLIFTSAVGGGAGTTFELVEGEWYTFTHTQRTAGGSHYNMSGSAGDYWGVGGFGDSSGKVDVYVKDVSVATETAPSVQATITTCYWNGTESAIANPTLKYIDGEWVYLCVASDQDYSENDRFMKITIDSGVAATTISHKVMFRNLSGATNTVYVPNGSLTATITDEAGNVVAADKLQPNVWYTITHTKGAALGGDWWHLGGFGKGTGGVDIYIKDVVLS